MGMKIDGRIGGTPLVTQSQLQEAVKKVQTRAAISTAESAATQTLAAATPAKLTLFEINLENFNMTADAANDQIIAVEAGQYSAELTVSGSYSTPNFTMQMHIVVVTDPRKEPGAHRKISAGGDVGNWSTGRVPIGALESGNAVYIEVESTGAGDLKLTDALLTVRRDGD